MFHPNRLNMSVLGEVLSSLVPLHMKSSESVFGGTYPAPKNKDRRLKYESSP